MSAGYPKGFRIGGVRELSAGLSLYRAKRVPLIACLVASDFYLREPCSFPLMGWSARSWLSFQSA